MEEKNLRQLLWELVCAYLGFLVATIFGYWIRLETWFIKLDSLLLDILMRSPWLLQWIVWKTFPSYLDWEARLSDWVRGVNPSRLQPMTWGELVQDGHHVVIEAKPNGEVVVVNYRHNTIFTVTGVPAQFSRVLAHF